MVFEFLEGYYDCGVCENDGGGFEEVIVSGVLSFLGCVFAAPKGLLFHGLLVQFACMWIVEANVYCY